MEKSLPWFRLHSKVLNNPKVQKLDGETFKIWVNLLCVTNDSVSSTILHSAIDDILWLLRVSQERYETAIEVLLERDLLIIVDGGYQPKDWHEWQYSKGNSTARVRKHREKKKLEAASGNASPEVSPAVSNTVTETPPEAEADTDSEAEKKSADPPPKETYPTLYLKFLKDIGAEDDMRMMGGAGIMKAWIDLGCDYETDILGPVKAVYNRQKAKGDPVSIAYFQNIPPQSYHQRIAVGANNPRPDVSRETSVSPGQWAERVDKFYAGGSWSKRAFGPSTDDPECRAPEDILEKYKRKGAA